MVCSEYLDQEIKHLYLYVYMVLEKYTDKFTLKSLHVHLENI